MYKSLAKNNQFYLRTTDRVSILVQERKTCFVFHQGKLEEKIERANEKKKKTKKRDQRRRGNYSMAKS